MKIYSARCCPSPATALTTASSSSSTQRCMTTPQPCSQGRGSCSRSCTTWTLPSSSRPGRWPRRGSPCRWVAFRNTTKSAKCSLEKVSQVAITPTLTSTKASTKYRFAPQDRQCYFEEEIDLAHLPEFGYRLFGAKTLGGNSLM